MKYLLALLFISIISLTTKGQNLQILADSIRVKNQIPEMAYAVITSDSVLELKTLGYHRIDQENEENKANNADYFHLGSNTKAITGFIAAYLVENNKIKWTTSFFDLFPTWKKGSNPLYYKITLEDLLSHRARIQSYTTGTEYQELPKFKGSKSEQRKEFSKYLLKKEPVKPSNKTYNYSNAGYSIAALMLEKVSGKTWEQLVNEVLFEKLNLNYKLGWPNRYELNQPWGHWIQNDTLRALPPNTDYNLNLGQPAGDISMSLKDYAKFIQLNLQGLSGRDNFLKNDTYEFLHFGVKDYAIGWANINTENKQLSEHAGSDGTFFCYTLIDKKKNLAYIILINTATNEAQQGLFNFLKLIEKKYGK
jgi:D-alanyl-D-alanine carboxypeptidase